MSVRHNTFVYSFHVITNVSTSVNILQWCVIHMVILWFIN